MTARDAVAAAVAAVEGLVVRNPKKAAVAILVLAALVVLT